MRKLPPLSAENTNLLRATLCTGPAAQNAWHTWRNCVDIENLDVAAYRLLPILYRNLQANGIGDPLLPRLRGVYKRTWLENQVLFTALDSVINQLAENNIDAVWMGEAALSKGLFGEGLIRPIAHAVLATPAKQHQQVLSIISKTDWQPPRTLRQRVKAMLGRETILQYQDYHLRLHMQTTQRADAATQLAFVLEARASFRPINHLVLLADIFHLGQQTSLQPFRNHPIVQLLQTLDL